MSYVLYWNRIATVDNITRSFRFPIKGTFPMAAIKFTAIKCSPSLPVIEKVCFKVTGDNRTFYVTSQPVYIWPGASPYQAIAQAGIQALVSVRDASEYTIPFNPFDRRWISRCITSRCRTSSSSIT
jgi:hypothetical protein